MKVVKTVSIVVLLAAFVVLFCWALIGDAKEQAAHNADEVAECRRLDGFARTKYDTGTLISCTFPAVR